MKPEALRLKIKQLLIDFHNAMLDHNKYNDKEDVIRNTTEELAHICDEILEMRKELNIKL